MSEKETIFETGFGEKEEAEKSSKSAMIFGMPVELLVAMAGEAVNSKEDIKQMIKIFEPVLDDAIDIALDVLIPKMSKIALAFGGATVSNRKEMLQKYIDAGFSREEGMMFIRLDIQTKGGQMPLASLMNAVSQAPAKKTAKK